jgi:hypothetical protein
MVAPSTARPRPLLGAAAKPDKIACITVFSSERGRKVYVAKAATDRGAFGAQGDGWIVGRLGGHELSA